MKNVLIFLLLVCFFPAFSQCNKNLASEKQVDKICEMISRLPEVIKTDNYCRKLSKGKRHLVTFLGGYPDGDDNYYLIKVAEDNGDSYHTWYLFAYNLDTKKVYFFDQMRDKYIPLRVWRKNYRVYM